MRRSTSRWPPSTSQLQYRPPAEIDLGRFSIWADQLVVDAASDEPDAGLIAGDVDLARVDLGPHRPHGRSG